MQRVVDKIHSSQESLLVTLAPPRVTIRHVTNLSRTCHALVTTVTTHTHTHTRTPLHGSISPAASISIIQFRGGGGASLSRCMAWRHNATQSYNDHNPLAWRGVAGRPASEARILLTTHWMMRRSERVTRPALPPLGIAWHRLQVGSARLGSRGVACGGTRWDGPNTTQ